MSELQADTIEVLMRHNLSPQQAVMHFICMVKEICEANGMNTYELVAKTLVAFEGLDPQRELAQGQGTLASHAA